MPWKKTQIAKRLGEKMLLSTVIEAGKNCQQNLALWHEIKDKRESSDGKMNGAEAGGLPPEILIKL